MDFSLAIDLVFFQLSFSPRANVIVLTDGKDVIVPWFLHVFPMDAVIMEAALIKAFVIVIVIIRERIAPFI